MYDKLQEFMTMSDLMELLFVPDNVPDKDLKYKILALITNGSDTSEIWDVIKTFDEE